MMKKISILVLIVFPAIIYAGGWPQPKGEGYFKLNYYTISTNALFDDNGVVKDNLGTLKTSNLSIYGEYGFTKRLTGIVYTPVWVNNSYDLLVKTKYNGFGDIDLGVKYGIIIDKPFVLSASLVLGLPSGVADNEKTNFLNTGDGEFNQILMLESGTAGNKWWASAGIGFNNRTNDFSDEIRYTGELGYKFLKDRLLAIIKINGISALNNGDATINPLGLYSNNVGYLSFTPEIAYNFNDNFGLVLSAGLAAAGRNVQAAPSFSAGVYYQLK